MPDRIASGYKILGGVVLLAAIITYALLLLHPVNLVTADLGRHIKNGEQILSGHWQAVWTNFYSFSHPDFPVLNHHFGSGVLFYLFYELGGFTGLQVMLALFVLLASSIMIFLAYRLGSVGGTALGALFALPLLAERTELRPEFLSYLFLAVFLWLLFAFRARRLTFRSLIIIFPVLSVLWVNSHIYFFLGPLVLGAFWLESLIVPEKRKDARRFFSLLVISCLAALVNPSGLAGALAPLTIFENYGYRVLENQSLWFLWNILPRWVLAYFAAVAIIAVGVFGIALARSRRQPDFPWAVFLLTLAFAAAGFLGFRNFALFGFILPIALSSGIGYLNISRKNFSELLFNILAVFLSALLLGICLAGGARLIFPRANPVGLGLLPGNNTAADFLKTESISGPIFNNYDIGGYLIYHLYPREKIFVDNRPEAYPAEFFTETYVPMQESDIKWQAADAEYKFNAIIFGYRDQTPWGQNFIISRVNDQEWAPVFADQQIIILLKRNEQNRDLILRHELPKDIFRVVQN